MHSLGRLDHLDFQVAHKSEAPLGHKDQSGMQSFVNLLDRIHETVKLGSRRAGAQYVGSEPEQSVQTMTGLVQ